MKYKIESDKIWKKKGFIKYPEKMLKIDTSRKNRSCWNLILNWEIRKIPSIIR